MLITHKMPNCIILLRLWICRSGSGRLTGNHTDVQMAEPNVTMRLAGCTFNCIPWYALCRSSSRPSTPAQCIPSSRPRPRQGVNILF